MVELTLCGLRCVSLDNGPFWMLFINTGDCASSEKPLGKIHPCPEES